MSTGSQGLRIGDVIDGRYRVLAEIGRGGFGVVLKAEQLSTGQHVAIKALISWRQVGKKAAKERARFEREMKLIGRLKHPNLVRLIDFGDFGGVPYMVLEYVEGESLSAVLKREGRLQTQDALRLMRQVLEALAKAHEEGVLHRDLKPGNIMITTGAGGRRDAIVLDFGIATLLEDARDDSFHALTAHDEVVGTVLYMAPEVVLKEAIVPQSDLYAWGLLFIEVLSGEVAVTGKTQIEIAQKQASDAPIELPETITIPWLRDLLRRVTAKPLAERFESATEILSILDAAVVHFNNDSPAAPATPIPRSAMIGGGLALLVLIGVLIAFAARTPEENVGGGGDSSGSDEPEAGTVGARCQRTSECGEGRVCEDSKCVMLTSEHCQTIEGPTSQDNVLRVGAITDHAQYSRPYKEQAARLAVKDINDAGGLPGGRKLLLIGCDSGSDDARAIAAARHLETLGVPVLFGPNYSGIFLNVVSEVAIPAGIFTITGGASSSMITHLDDRGLVWRTVSSDRLVAEGIAARLDELAPKSVVAYVKDDAFGNGLLGGVSASLRVVDAASMLKAIAYPAVGADFEAMITRHAEPLAEVVVLLGTQESLELIHVLESIARNRSEAPPRYLITHGFTPQTLAVVRAQPDLAERLEIISPVDRSEVYFNDFKLRFQSVYGAGEIPGLVANFYDAVFVAALAISALPVEAEVTGERIASMMDRLTKGDVLEVGARRFGEARAKLSMGGVVDLEGVSGSLDFDLATGDVSGALRHYLVRDDNFIYFGDFVKVDEATRWVFRTALYEAARVTVPSREVTLGMPRRERSALRREFSEALESLDEDQLVVEEGPWTQPALEVLAYEVRWSEWRRAVTLSSAALDEVCAAPLPAPGPGSAAVRGVGAGEAERFCALHGMRLPTTREWEALARGPEGRAFGFEADLDEAHAAQLLEPVNSGALPWNRTPEGIYDLSGGVPEWVRCEEGDAALSICVEGFTLKGGENGAPSPWWYAALSQPVSVDTSPRCLRSNGAGFRCVRTLDSAPDAP